jgi:hypothetical protein
MTIYDNCGNTCIGKVDIFTFSETKESNKFNILQVQMPGNLDDSSLPIIA